jgi:hypothetical protein
MKAHSSIFRRDPLRTTIEVTPVTNPLRYGRKIMLMGSCFTEHIGNRLRSLKYDVSLNPFGIVYNPLSMAAQLQRVLAGTHLDDGDLVLHQGLWHSWMHHGHFSDTERDRLIDRAGKGLLEASAFLKEAGMLILTFGTPVAWYLRSDGRLVSNCHQVPSVQFYERRSSPEELLEAWKPVIRLLRDITPDLLIGLTISPVRYFKEGPEGNQLSKAVLILFVNQLREAFPDIFYFPAYEIFMDDLRDYRFYDIDMMHPGPAGIDYVWDRFAEACLDPSESALRREVESVSRAVNHRPRSTGTGEYAKFAGDLLERMERLQREHRFLDFSAEREILSARGGENQS